MKYRASPVFIKTLLDIMTIFQTCTFIEHKIFLFLTCIVLSEFCLYTVIIVMSNSSKNELHLIVALITLEQALIT